ncbi:MAG: hypothetical protein ACLS70_00900 [[Clostridium] symbiosum]|uniref:hypothetical protein n=1 Tax=Lachnospiraceae TaxID=186803 RepID=UPI00138F92FA|nr:MULTISPECIES: hypothetical protein [Lachnospiraceae]MBO1699249.1 hypothetical protein [[Clostridium] symbiosum]QQR04236.1 hypothetical protein I5Q83_17360 [Enterocloster clostridioformis]
MKKHKNHLPPGSGSIEAKQRFRCLLRQRPKPYPNRPQTRKNSLIRPARRS